MTDAAITSQLKMLTDAVLLLTRQQGTRLSQADLCERLGIHRATLARYRTDRAFPRPDKSGKWLLADVVKWEMERPTSQQETQATRCNT